MSENMYAVSSSPHIRSKDSVQGIMRDVVIALMPAAIAGTIFFKLQGFLVILLSVLSCIAAEALWQKLTHKNITVKDLSAVITGLLLAFNMPADVPLWLPVVGGFFAIIIVKQLFGGLGQNIVNPALAARAVLLSSWPVHMTSWTVDGISTATPLAILKTGAAAPTSMMTAFIGNMGGCIGETSALALLIGGAYLLYRRVISWHIPVAYIGTVFILTTVIGRTGFLTGNGLYEILIGGVMLGAIFMATDYTTSPMTKKGQLIFGLGCGILTSLIRIFGGYAEGVSYSILIMNLFVPLIDRYTAPKVFGEVK
jgi:H+/Na+-translocating ferredoxin:NAD+ oxidoreductase subunit D